VAGIIYDGDVRELLRLWIKTTGLTILTFGFYRFWGRTRIRRYLWSRISLLGDRFEYDGTGRELFMRFLLTVAVVLLPLAAIGVALEFSGLDAGTVWVATHSEFLIAAFLSLAGRYFGQRYRLSRSLWRGLRGGLDGNAWIYALRAAGLTLLQIATLGFSRPWLYTGLWRYEARNTRLGSRRLAFEGRAREIFWTWAATLVLGTCAMIAFALMLALIIVMTMGLMVLAGAIQRGQAPGFDFRLLASGVSAYVIYVVAIGAVWTILTSAFERRWMVYSIGATVLDDIRMRLETKTSEVCWFRIGNFLLTILTLNLAWPFVAHRTLAFYSRALRLDAAGFERLSQTEAPSLPPASGIAELFDTAGFA
jgi:uncharacterized membrane protein YjgN (DUF898 family)